MKANAIICEYNPFHNGHKYQIDCIKEKSDNAVVAVMSGNFTQRGDVAIKNKFERAEYALKNGIDLVIELPAVYATANAEVFAKAGVRIADALGCVENLCFSTESGNDKYLPLIADAFGDEKFNNSVKEFMNTGTYYPKAVEYSLGKLYSKEVADIVKEPNNVLGIEYLKALKSTNISPMIITRTGVGHNEEKCVENITNAGNIRKIVISGEVEHEKYMPEKMDFSDFGCIGELEKILLYKLRCMTADDFANLPDVNEGLENRFVEAVKRYNSITEILEAVKTKRYTMARLRRILIHALLGITKEDSATPVPYIRVLGFSEKGQQLLSDIKTNGKLPLITNVADGYKNLDDTAKRIFDIDVLATDIYSLATNETTSTKDDFTRQIIRT